jgi:hypothetical protein
MNVLGPTRKKIVDTRVAKLLDERRFCYVIPESGYIAGKGFRVSIAIERESGHFPTGSTPEGGDIEPWYWGNTFEEAREICDRQNKDHLGLDAIDAFKIVMSTMGGRPETPSQKRAQARARATTKPRKAKQ